MKINSSQLRIKAHYFFFMASTGTTYPYISVYGKQLGISPLALGIICTIFPILHLIAKPIFGFIMDYSQWRKLVFIALIVITNGSLIVIFFLPSPSGPMLLEQHFQNVSCASLPHCDMEYHASAIASCNGTKDTTCHWICKDMNFSTPLSFYTDQQKAIISPDTTCLLNINETSFCQRSVINNYNCNVTCDDFENQCIYTSVTFWSFVLLWSLGEINYYTSLSLCDAICIGILGKNKRLQYGKQRLWATMGYGIAACLSGYMIDLWSQGETHKTYTSMLILMLVFSCIDLIVCIKLELPHESRSKTILKDVFTLLKSKSMIIFLCFVTFAGILNGIKINFLFWYVEDLAIATGYMGKIKLIEGLIIAAEAFGGEIIFLFFSGKILNKLGYSYTLIFCFLCYALRLGLISLSPLPWWIIPIELILHGPSYALCLTTIVAYASVVAPPGALATVQGLVQGMSDGLGLSIGSLIGGILYKKFGGSMTLRIFSVFAAISALVYFIFYTLFVKNKVSAEESDTRNTIKWRNIEDARKHIVVET